MPFGMDRILIAPEPLIRAVLVALCDNERLHSRSLRYLDRLEKLHPALTAPPASAEHAFLPDDNNTQACAFHHGSLGTGPSHQTCAGGYSDTLQNDTEDNREDRPEGFLWSCCGRGGAGPGCTEGEHLAVRAEDRAKRPRRLDLAADPDELRVFEGKVLRPNEFVNEYLLHDDDDDDDDDGRSDGEPPWREDASRGVASPGVKGDGDDGGGGGGGGHVQSEATERDSGCGSD